jgi:8-oxo-dGTP diphosphatase
VFEADGKHYVTLFILAASGPGEPDVREPAKCAGWSWHAWSDLPQPLFAPLETLRSRGFVPMGAV